MRRRTNAWLQANNAIFYGDGPMQGYFLDDQVRDEFIDSYVKRNELEQYRTADGFHVLNTQSTIALPCSCGNELCQGWQMVPGDCVEWEIHTLGRLPYMIDIEDLREGD